MYAALFCFCALISALMFYGLQHYDKCKLSKWLKQQMSHVQNKNQYSNAMRCIIINLLSYEDSEELRTQGGQLSVEYLVYSINRMCLNASLSGFVFTLEVTIAC